jgi:hypothetical protein
VIDIETLSRVQYGDSKFRTVYGATATLENFETFSHKLYLEGRCVDVHRGTEAEAMGLLGHRIQASLDQIVEVIP